MLALLRKAFKVLEKIEAMEGEDIPTEVAEVVKAVIAWHGGKKTAEAKAKKGKERQGAES